MHNEYFAGVSVTGKAIQNLIYDRMLFPSPMSWKDISQMMFRVTQV